MFSRFCRKNSAIMPEVGAPMASPSCWMRIFSIVGEVVLFCNNVVPVYQFLSGLGFYLVFL